MDMLPVKSTKNCTKKKPTTKKKLKVVYISSPMKVKTSASRFRALVQELTGRDSDISRYDLSYFDPVAPPATITQGGSLDHRKVVHECDQQSMHLNGSESFWADLFGVDQLEGMFPSYSLYDSCLH